jgi:hypothetical protein
MSLYQLTFCAWHSATTHYKALFSHYDTITRREAGLKPVHWMMSNNGQGTEREGRGGYNEAATQFRNDEYILVQNFSDGYDLSIYRPNDRPWEVKGSRTGNCTMSASELRQQLSIFRKALDLPGLIRAVVSREHDHHTQFPLRPPIAAANYAVITTEADVNAAYLEPEVFWNAWDTIEEHGDFRLCTRGLHLPDPIDERAWLAHTFDDSMAMARAARPKQTWYGLASRPGPRYAPFWEPGDPADGKAGFACIAPIGYDPATRTVEYTAYVPPPTGGIPNHLLLYDIHIIRAAVIRKKTLKGEPVDTVRVVFLDEAAARAERRPLLDVGARVFFHTADKRLVELTD